MNQRGSLRRGNRADLRGRRQYEGALYNTRPAFFVEEGNQRFADGELGDRGFDIEFWIGTKRFCRGFDRFLIFGREGAQRMLHAIAELTEHGFRHVQRILRDEINANAFRAR